MLVAGEPFGHLRDLLLLLFDEGAKMLDRLPRVLGGDAGAVAVVAAPAGGDEVRGLPEQVRRLRARDQMVDGCRIAGASRPFDLANVAVVGGARLGGAVASVRSSICGPSFGDRDELWGKMPDNVLASIALLGGDARLLDQPPTTLVPVAVVVEPMLALASLLR
jgi:hypothetical protein